MYPSIYLFFYLSIYISLLSTVIDRAGEENGFFQFWRAMGRGSDMKESSSRRCVSSKGRRFLSVCSRMQKYRHSLTLHRRDQTPSACKNSPPLLSLPPEERPSSCHDTCEIPLLRFVQIDKAGKALMSVFVFFFHGDSNERCSLGSAGEEVV